MMENGIAISHTVLAKWSIHQVITFPNSQYCVCKPCSLDYDKGDTYEGYWHRGQRQGAGIMNYTRGTFVKYDGEWAGHVQSGKGVLDYRNGIRYEGMFKAGKQHGAGILLHPGGIRFDKIDGS